MASSGLSDTHPAMRTMQADATRTFKRANAQADSLKMYRKGAPRGTHKSFAEGTEGFDGVALTSESSPKPPRVSIPRGSISAESLPKAVGTPALAQRAAGTENLGTKYQCFEAGNTRPEASGARKALPAGVQSFNDAGV